MSNFFWEVVTNKEPDYVQKDFCCKAGNTWASLNQLNTEKSRRTGFIGSPRRTKTCPNEVRLLGGHNLSKKVWPWNATPSRSGQGQPIPKNKHFVLFLWPLSSISKITFWLVFYPEYGYPFLVPIHFVKMGVLVLHCVSQSVSLSVCQSVSPSHFWLIDINQIAVALWVPTNKWWVLLSTNWEQ